jgi:hypothetical protein
MACAPTSGKPEVHAAKLNNMTVATMSADQTACGSSQTNHHGHTTTSHTTAAKLNVAKKISFEDRRSTGIHARTRSKTSALCLLWFFIKTSPEKINSGVL